MSALPILLSPPSDLSYHRTALNVYASVLLIIFSFFFFFFLVFFLLLHLKQYEDMD